MNYTILYLEVCFRYTVSLRQTEYNDTIKTIFILIRTSATNETVIPCKEQILCRVFTVGPNVKISEKIISKRQLA